MATSAQSIYAATTLDPAYDVKKDFAPIIRVASLSLVLVAHPSLGVSNLRELIALAKQNPDQIFYGSSGVGTVTHMAGELLNMMAGIKLVAVPYPGSAQALTDALSGRVPLLITPAVVRRSADRERRAQGAGSRRLRSVPVSHPKSRPWPRPACPATISICGSACSRRPERRRATVGKLAHIADMALKADDIGGAMRRVGIDPVGGSPEDFARYIDAEVKKATDVAVTANLRK